MIKIGKIGRTHGLKGDVIVNVGSIETAQRLRGLDVFISNDGFVVASDEVLTADLVGMTVVDENGKNLGVVKSVENYGASDIIECAGFSFPYIDEFVIETNTKKRTLVVRSSVLD